MSPLIARSIAAVGVILGLASIWARAAVDGGSYWSSPHHDLGITILALVILAGVGVVLAFVSSSPLFDRLWVMAGMALGGFLLFIPIEAAGASYASHLRAGVWLGVASLVVFLVAGALLPFSPSSQPQISRSEPVSAAAATAGWYPDPTGQTRLRYWDGAIWTENTSA